MVALVVAYLVGWVWMLVTQESESSAVEDSPAVATTGLTLTARPSAVATGSAGVKGPDPISYDICRHSGPAAVALDGGMSPDTPWTEIAFDFGDDVFSDEKLTVEAAESCLLGFADGDW